MKAVIKNLVQFFPPLRRRFERLNFLEAETVGLKKKFEAKECELEAKEYELEAKLQELAALEMENTRLAVLLSQTVENVQRAETELSIWSRFFFHALSPDPVCEHGFSEGSAIRKDKKLVSRIERIAKASELGGSERRFVWDILADNHRDYIATLNHERLSSLATSPLTNGLLQGDTMTALLKVNEQQRGHWANVALDALLCLCEAMELIPVEDVELGVRCQVGIDTPDRLLDAISQHVGFEVHAPDVFSDLFGLRTRRGVFTFRHCVALFVAWRLATQYSEKKNIRIAEIGAGAGLVAYYARQFGFSDYTIFDLPTVNIVQSWFLGQSLSEESLVLADDPMPFEREGLRILPPEYLGRAPEDFWEVTVNVDSMPEIDPDIVAKYLETLSTRTRYIYSFNHEARPTLDGTTYCTGKEGAEQKSAHQLQEPMAWHVEKNGRFVRQSRNRAWLRPGYVEEWYERVAKRDG